MADEHHYEEHRHFIPRPPEGGNTTDFIVSIFAVLVASVIGILTISAVLAVFISGADPKPFFTVLIDLMTTIISALVGYLAGKGSGRTEADELAAKRAEREAERAHQERMQGEQ